MPDVKRKMTEIDSPIEDLWPEYMQTSQNTAVATKLNANKSI